MKKGSPHQSFIVRSAKEMRANNNEGMVIDAGMAEDGTIRLYLNGEKYPVRIYPDQNAVLIVSAIKRMIPLILGNIRKQNISAIITLIALKMNFNVILGWLENLFFLYDILLKEEHWSQPIKEVRRVLKGKVDSRIIDGISLVLEFDSAYRFIFQDIAAEIDRTNLEMRPRKEVLRLMDIAIARANGGDVDKFRNIKKILSLLLYGKLAKIVQEVAKEVNLDELKPSPEDTYWMYYLKTYNCFGLSQDCRMARYNKLKYGELKEQALDIILKDKLSVSK